MGCEYFILFFCFKQKTAYEMRISDLSSDVCSSDLRADERHRHGGFGPERVGLCEEHIVAAAERRARVAFGQGSRIPGRRQQQHRAGGHADPLCAAQSAGVGADRARTRGRSEEHTSELQSLMRISYAVFCLKKKNTQEL